MRKCAEHSAHNSRTADSDVLANGGAHRLVPGSTPNSFHAFVGHGSSTNLKMLSYGLAAAANNPVHGGIQSYHNRLSTLAVKHVYGVQTVPYQQLRTSGLYTV